MMKLLVTGATGYLGQNIVKRLLVLNEEVHIVVRENSDLSGFENLKKIVNIHSYDGSIESMCQIFHKAKPECVIHLAAKYVSEHTTDDIQAIFESNILLGMHLLEGMKVSKCKRLITTGTNWQNAEGKAYKPVNLYAATKEAFEDLVMHYVYQEEIQFISLRIYDTYGPKDKRNKIMNLFKKYEESEASLDMSPGEQLLGLVYIDDIIKAYEVAINRIMSSTKIYKEVFYLTPVRFYSLKEIAQCYQQITGKKLNIQWGKKAYRAREVMKPYIGPRLPNWEPVIDLEQGIALLKEKDTL